MIESIYPATPSQQGFVLGALTAEENESLFVEQFSVPLIGPLDMERFRTTWRNLIRKNEILRTGFTLNVSDALKQIVLSEAAIEIEYVDSEKASAMQQEQEVKKIKRLHRSKAFDLTSPPLLRLALQRRSRHEHILIWSHHHGILDGWSQMKLVQAMLLDYHQSAPVHASPSFGKYAKWLTQEPADEKREFWVKALKNYPSTRPLPVSGTEPNRDFGEFSLSVSKQETQSLIGFANKHDLNLANVIITIWGLTLAQLQPVSRLVIGVTVSGRSERYPQSFEILGPCINTMPVGLHFEPDQAFSEFAACISDGIAQSYPYSDCSAGQIHQWLEYSSSHTLFDSVVAIGNYPMPEMSERPGFDLQIDPQHFEAEGGRTRQAISLVVYGEDTLTVRLVHRRDRVDNDAAIQLLDRLTENLRRFRDGQSDPLVAEFFQGRILPDVATEEISVKGGKSSKISSHNTIEQVVCHSFSNVLNIDDVSETDNFIEMGGHSILAIQLLQALRNRFAIDLTLQKLLRGPTPKDIAQHIRKALKSADQISENLPVVVRSGDPYTPFPLTEIQQAYWVGRQSGFAYGGVDAHLYAEVETVGIDLERLESCWQILVKRHSMLRTIFKDDAKQYVLKDVPDYEICRYDLTGQEEIEPAVKEIRARLENIRRSTSQWPLFTIEAAVLPVGKIRLFLSFDLLIGDAWSWKILYREIVRLYQDPSMELEPLEISYKDYAITVEKLRQTPQYFRDQAYWRNRLNDIPPPPQFPQLQKTSDKQTTKFVRRQIRLSSEHVALLLEFAADLGITPSTCLLAIFGETLAKFTGQRASLINLTVFNRYQIHPQIDQLVGDFTSLSLTAVCSRQVDEAFADYAKRLQWQVWKDLDHRLYSGIEVLRDITEKAGHFGAAKAPVVFTSTLDFSEVEPSPYAWDLVYGIGQTPQVTLDYQTYKIGEEIAIIWDSIDAYFPANYIDEMFRSNESMLYAMIVERKHSVTSNRLG